MKKFVVIALLLLVTTAYASDYCTGWEAGFIAGYCYEKTACVEPIVPICPIPKVGEDSYQDGYNRGFLAGLNKRR